MTGWSSRSGTEAGAALIALNRATELGGWVDEELDHLRELLDTITDDPPDAGDDVGPNHRHPHEGGIDVECPSCGHPFTV